MKSVGEKLRRERLQRGLDIAAVARLTRINQRYLEAIEPGKTEDLPSGFFHRSFVRQYASAMGLDVAEIEGELERAREAEAPTLDAALEQTSYAPKLADPIVAEGNQRGKGRIGGYVALLVAVLVGCSAFYSWWRRLEMPTIARQAETHAEEPSEASRQKPREQTESSAVKPAQDAQAPAGGSVTLTEVSSPRLPQVSPDDKVVIKIAATEETWLAITADGKTIFSGLLQPTQEIVLGGKERAFIRVGNAGGLAVSGNGKAIGPVGARGQVRNVLLTPESYRITGPDGSL